MLDMMDYCDKSATWCHRFVSRPRFDFRNCSSGHPAGTAAPRGRLAVRFVAIDTPVGPDVALNVQHVAAGEVLAVVEQSVVEESE